ncbi:tetratricopeptide repeat protein [Phenylobacterium sp. J426]|uniref:tetratricopeptide repeat protein n=1 Tax=Phenylobacterium sp. J426 TaxID=2898439 RepID=UPI0035AF62E1|nr:tetratricopeptide repeat protein [Phenylobacterium sp. J426]
MSLAPEDATLSRDLARLAGLMDRPDLAEQFLHRARRQDPASVEIVNDLACAWCAQARFGEAIGLLQEALTADPSAALLWNTLGCVLFEQGDAAQSLVFFDEAIRLDARMHAAWFNRANARRAVGDPRGALADCEQAIALGADSAAQGAMYRYGRALALLTAGEVGAGWDAYAVRNEASYAGYVQHELAGQVWQRGRPLAGRRLLVVGEQGLGDEVLFASVIPDVARDLGAEGKLILAVEPRLAPLFRRSFPAAEVVAYETRLENARPVRCIRGVAPEDYDAWARMGDFLATHRRGIASFPTTPGGFLKADPTRVAHWSAVLAEFGEGPKVGVIWRSLMVTAQRQKFYPSLELWAPLFATPGVIFVNLQVGDSADEVAAIVQATGADVRSLPGLDLKNDLDDLAALSCALDLVVGPATATTNIAAAAGATAWFATTPDAWPRLGTAAFPWYPQARAFSGDKAYDWPGVMAAVAAALHAQLATP